MPRSEPIAMFFDPKEFKETENMAKIPIRHNGVTKVMQVPLATIGKMNEGDWRRAGVVEIPSYMYDKKFRELFPGRG